MEYGEEQPALNFVPCLKWVMRGKARAVPDQVQLTTDDLVDIIRETQRFIREANEEEDKHAALDEDDEYDFEHYDEDTGSGNGFLNLNSIASISTETAAIAAAAEECDTDSEREDDIIKPDDNLILVGRMQGDACNLEVYIYNAEEGSLYVHHEYMLSSFPLCLEWLDHDPGSGQAGNLCAVGSMSPVIDVWDLDMVNCVEPAFRLGQEEVGSRRQRHRRRHSGHGHSKAVLDLAWNRPFHHVLASSSADNTCLVWDLDAGTAHTRLPAPAPQALRWHASEAHRLLVGCMDAKCRLFDCRSAEAAEFAVKEGEEVEKVAWLCSDEHLFAAGSSGGALHVFDSRMGELWSAQAVHSGGEVTGLGQHSACPDLLATTGADGLLKAWDLQRPADHDRLVLQHDLNMDLVHCMEFCPDVPFVIAAGGHKKTLNLRVLDLFSLDAIKNTFESRETNATTSASDADDKSMPDS